MNVFETITECRVCASSNLSEVLDLGDQPPANSLRTDVAMVLPRVPLILLFCNNCSTVQLSASVEPEFLFQHYLWVTGTSSTAKTYSEIFAKQVFSRLQSAEDSKEKHSAFVVEVASNDGTVLKQFQNLGCRVLGVDPAKNVAQLAIENGVPTRADFFNVEAAKQIVSDEGAADIIIARNVIPHVKAIHPVIEGMSKVIKSSGLGVIEFHYADTIAKELHYDSIYHEHLFYFSLKTLSGLLKRYGLFAYDLMHSPISGGSLVLFLSKENLPMSKDLLSLKKKEAESGLNNLSTWEKFASESRAHSRIFADTVISASAKGEVVGYGASARSSTLLNFCNLGHDHLSHIIDRNPLKHGYYAPGSDIPIVSYEEGVSKLRAINDIVLLAWNFEQEIVRDLRSLDYGGRFIIPLPGQARVI